MATYENDTLIHTEDRYGNREIHYPLTRARNVAVDEATAEAAGAREATAAAVLDALAGLPAALAAHDEDGDAHGDIRAALEEKQSAVTGAASSITGQDLTASRALVSDAGGKVAAAGVTATELGYLSGVTGAVQTQINGKAATSHNHAAGNITSGTLPVARGGTGLGTFTPNRLLYPSAATTLTQLAFPAAAGSVLRQGTSGAPYWTSLADLLAALGSAGGTRIETGSYTGTGTYGSTNPNTLTFSFAPKLVAITSYLNEHGQLSVFVNPATRGFAIDGNYEPGNVTLTWNDKTVSWYGADKSVQQNYDSRVYNYVALG